MNWYKNIKISQITNRITIKNIRETIDSIILQDPEIITDQDIAEAFQRNNLMGVTQNYMGKAAQTMAPSKYPQKIKNIFPSKENISYTKQIEKEIAKNIGFKITARTVANFLGIDSNIVKKVLKEEETTLDELGFKRKKILEDKIVLLVDISSPFDTYDKVAIAFENKYKYKINQSIVRRAMIYRNRSTSKAKREGLIFIAFKSYLQDQMGGSIETYMTKRKPGGDESFEVAKFIDRFLDRYGYEFGFESPIDKKMLKNLFMTKVQLRDATITEKELGKFFNQYFDNYIRNQIVNLIQQGFSSDKIALKLGLNSQEVNKFYQLYQTKNFPIDMSPQHPSSFVVDRDQYA